MLARGDAERILRLVAEAGSRGEDDPFTEELLVELGELVRADWVGYSEDDWSVRRGPATIQRPGDDNPTVDWEAIEALFWAEFGDLHPIRRAALRGYVGALRISDFASRRVLRRSRFYNEWMRLTHAEHCLDLSLRAPPNCTRTFHFDRAGGQDFSERDRAVLNALEPHLARLSEHARVRRELTAAREELKRTYSAAEVESAELTAREREILAWVAQGKTNREIAELLWLAPSTVRKHLENVYAKLGVRTRTAAVAQVFQLRGS
jgi:DNA-binding CsgD family transcriptional regulator